MQDAKTIVAGVPVVVAQWGALRNRTGHVKVEDGMLYQGHIARSTDSLTLAACIYVLTENPVFKVHIKLTIVNNKPLCDMHR